MTPDLIFRVLGDKWLRLVVLLAVLAALAQQVSLVVWHLLPSPDTATVTSTMEAFRQTENDQTGVSIQQQAKMVGRAFLFGRQQQEEVVVEVEEAPETQLNYKLRGVYYSEEPRLAMAIVEVQPNKSKHYAVDDELADNIVLAKIEPDHILINRYGKLERLNLQKRVAPAGRGFQSRAEAGGSSNQLAVLRSYKQRYSRNPMALATRFQAIPVQQDGRNIGFKLKALRGESLLRKLNFEPNDVFLAVNGVELNNPFEALDALKSLTTAENISVTFIRDGAEQTLDFRI